MIPAILGLGGLTAKIIASAVIPRVVRAISSSFSTTKANEPCPPPAVEGISSVSDTPPVPPGSGVFVPRESLRKWGYAGLWHHQASGLDLATFRVYDAANKRWISRDPLGEGVDYNLYRYCGNDPINTVDPDGLLPEGGGGAVLRGLTNFARGIGRAGMAAAENPNTWRVIGTGARAAGAAAALPEVVAGAAAGYAAEAAWTYGTTYPAQQVLTKGAQFSNETMRLMNDGRRAVQTGRGLNCPQVADAILKDFQAQGIDAKIVEIYVEDKHGFIVRDGIKNTISNDGTHRLVEAEGRLYDAFSGQSGIPRSQWRRYYDGATPINIR